jgi:enoyl-CoA hydratase
VGGEGETSHVHVGEEGEKVATVVLSRVGKRNALNSQLRSELIKVLEAIEGTESIRAVVLTGDEDSEAFVAGADITELQERGSLEQREVSFSPRIYEAVDDLRQPVIAALNGYTLGGGCELAMACDIRIAHSEALLGQPEINLGIIPGGGGTQRLPRLVGEGQAMRLILSGELIDADEACEINLVDEVYDDDEFHERVYELAAHMADKSPIALQIAKEAVKASSRMHIENGFDYEREMFVHLFETKDKNEGIDAFLEDRDPEWIGE